MTHTQRDSHLTQNQGENKPTETDPHLMEILKGSDKELKTVTNMLKEMMEEMMKSKDNLIRELKSIKKD